MGNSVNCCNKKGSKITTLSKDVNSASFDSEQSA